MDETSVIIHRRFAIAIVGLVLVLISPVLWVLTLRVNFLHRTGLAMWVAIAVGLAFSLWAAWGDARIRTRAVVLVDLACVALAFTVFFVFARLPESAGLAAIDQVNDFTLPDQTGKDFTLSEHLKDGPVLLIFYRGHW